MSFRRVVGIVVVFIGLTWLGVSVSLEAEIAVGLILIGSLLFLLDD